MGRVLAGQLGGLVGCTLAAALCIRCALLGWAQGGGLGGVGTVPGCQVEASGLGFMQQGGSRDAAARLDAVPGGAGGAAVEVIGRFALGGEQLAAGVIGEFGLDRHGQACPLFAGQVGRDAEQGLCDQLGGYRCGWLGHGAGLY